MSVKFDEADSQNPTGAFVINPTTEEGLRMARQVLDDPNRFGFNAVVLARVLLNIERLIAASGTAGDTAAQ